MTQQQVIESLETIGDFCVEFERFLDAVEVAARYSAEQMGALTP